MRKSAYPLEAVILAAGGSTRMGSPKALLDVDGVPLVVRHVSAFIGVGAAVTVVVGAHSARIRAVLPKTVRVVENPDWEATDASRSAFLGLREFRVAFVTPVDVPPARHETLCRLLEAGAPAVPQVAGRDGHPILVAPPHIEQRLDERTRMAIRVSVSDPNCLLNLNTPDAFAAWLCSR